MDDSEARESLESGDPRSRLAAARYLHRRAKVEDRSWIEAALNRESDMYVRAALMRALVSIPMTTLAPAERKFVASAETNDELRASITRDLTELLSHELKGVIGAVFFYAKREITDYPSSDTAREIERLRSLLKAISQLGEAAKRVDSQLVNVAKLFSEIVQAARVLEPGIEIHTTGVESLEVVTDPGLVDFVVRNAIDNAVDAVLEAATGKGSIVVTWGKDDRAFWVAVLDDGIGLGGSLDDLKNVGVSTKSENAGHAGMGLAIASQAAESLGGVISLEPGEPNGARFRLEVPLREVTQ